MADILVETLDELTNALSSATAGDTIWVRRTTYNPTSTLSPAKDGTATSPIRLIGWPFYRQETGTVQEAVTGKEKWAFKTTSLTDTDLNYWTAAVVEFTDPDDPNYGQKRKVIWYEYDSDNSIATVYLDFDLPNNIGNYSFTITLETEEYGNRPQDGIDAGWDNDSLVRPVFDGSDLSSNLFDFNSDYWWYVYNIECKNVGGYRVINYSPKRLWNCVIHDCVKYAVDNALGYLKDVYCWRFTDTNYSTITCRGLHGLLEDIHIQGHESYNAIGINMPQGQYRLKNVTLGKVISLYYGIRSARGCIGENVIINATVPIHCDSGKYGTGNAVYISSYNGDSKLFYQKFSTGDVYNVYSDATISPPSECDTYIKLVPSSEATADFPLKLEFSRKQTAGTKTYTFKIHPVGWTSLTTDDVYVKAWYLDDAGSHRSELIAYPESVTNNTWNDISLSLTTEQDGTVYFELCLTKYESGCYIAFDPKFGIS